MSKRSKKLEEIRNMFKDIDINFDDINDNGISEFIKIIKLTKDERYQPNTKHLMSDIIMITFFAIISKATEWKEIESFAKKEEKWLKIYLELPNGIPSHDTIQRLISILDSKILYENCLKYFIEIVDKYIPKEENEKDVYSIDGKTTNSSSRSSLTSDIKWINGYKNWEGLKSIGLEIKTIENLQTGEVTEERRHYIVSFENDINNFKEAVRKHWEIENNLHAPLDIIFKEDKNKTLEKNGAKNLGILRRIALMILKLVQVFYNKSMKLIMYELSLDFENEIENIFKLLKPELINQFKNT